MLIHLVNVKKKRNKKNKMNFYHLKIYYMYRKNADTRKQCKIVNNRKH